MAGKGLPKVTSGRRDPIPGLLLVLGLIPLFLTCSPRSSPTNIVIITIDTLRADHLGMYGYFRETSPFLDAFAEECVWFQNCFAPMATTLPSHLSLLTGVYPLEHGVMGNVQDGGRPYIPSPLLRSLPEAAQLSGFETAAFISAVPLKSHSGIQSGFDLFDEPDGAERRAGMTNLAVFQWLEARGAGPYLLWVHYFDPHSPYDAPPAYRSLFPSDDRSSEYMDERRFTEKAVTGNGRVSSAVETMNDYDREVRYVDDSFGALMERLRAEPDWGSTIVIVAGDHGEGLGQHREWHHGLCWEEHLRVPLLIRIPGRPAGRSKKLVSLVDVLPTVLGSTVGIQSGRLMEQASGFDMFAEPIDRFIVGQSSKRRVSGENPYGVLSIRTEDWKLIYRSSGKNGLFHIPSDPYELRNVVFDRPEVVKRLSSMLLGHIENQTRKAGEFRVGGDVTEPDTLDADARRDLRGLGYAN